MQGQSTRSTGDARTARTPALELQYGASCVVVAFGYAFRHAKQFSKLFSEFNELWWFASVCGCCMYNKNCNHLWVLPECRVQLVVLFTSGNWVSQSSRTRTFSLLLIRRKTKRLNLLHWLVSTFNGGTDLSVSDSAVGLSAPENLVGKGPISCSGKQSHLE